MVVVYIFRIHFKLYVMKKSKILLLFTYVIVYCSSAFSQGTNDLQSHIEPNKSMGFIYWKPMEDAKYLVKYLSMNPDSTFSVVALKETTKNFLKLDKSVYGSNDGYYSISAHDIHNGSLIQEGDIYPYTVGGPNDVEKICDRDCSGSNYAYRLAIYEDQNTLSTYMRAEPAIKYYDYVLDVAVPYYFAISDQALTSLSSSHPWNLVSDYGPTGAPIYAYKRIQLTPSTPGGPYYNASGMIINDGWLIEKKANEFEHFITGITSAEPSLNQCDPNTVINTGGAWENYFNNYYDPNTLQQVPTSTPFAGGIVPSQLMCDRTPPAGSGSSPGDFLTNELISLTDLCWEEIISINPDSLNSINNLIDCLEGNPIGTTPGGGDLEITGIRFVPKGHNASTITVPISTGFDLDDINQLSAGLYETILFTNSETVLSFFTEIEINEQEVLADHIRVTLTPTIIQNNMLKFHVKSDITTEVNIQVYNLNGEMYQSENVSLDLSYDHFGQVEISGDVPYNQVRVKVTAEDGSFVEEIALKMN